MVALQEMKLEPYRIFQCMRCKKLELNWDSEAKTVGTCGARKALVKIYEEYTLDHPAPNCDDWVKGKPKKCKKV